MQSQEITAVGELAGEAVGGFGTLVRDMHRAIAGRTFRALGPLGAPVRVIHDSVATGVHAGVRASLRAGPRAGGAAIARRARPDAARLGTSTGGGFALAALNGAVGDILAERGNDLALKMTIRRRGEDVDVEPDAVARAFPDATPQMVVFVHGLIETDEAWHVFPLRGREPGRRAYGARLRDDLGYTPVYLRYNTGRHISDSGADLSRLLEDLVAAWPVDVEEIVLVGHSMGGLVARSACHRGEADGAAWTDAVAHVFCLGSPHLGAPMEKAANAFGWTLGRLPETRPFAKLVNGRSVGIKDLRFGSCAEADWLDCDPDEFLRDRVGEMPFLPDATYYFVGATLSREENGPLGQILGDLLVRFPSASGRGRRRNIPFEIDKGMHIGGITHIDLLNHPSVYEQMRSWLSRARVGRIQA
jgi:pimeloyl-ACP methyl ester carboxylesterase